MKKKTIETYYCTVVVDVFKTAVLVLVASTMEDVFKDLPEIYRNINPKIDPSKDIRVLEDAYEEDGFMPPGHTIQLPNEAGDVIMIFKENSISSVTEELIVHETHHASHYICDYRGVKDEETEAYVQEHLFNQIMCKIDEWNDSHRKK